MFHKNWPDPWPKLALLGKAFLLRVEGVVAELAAGEAGESLGREVALTKRWSNLPERDDCLFPFFGCALLVFSGFAFTPW